MSHLKNKIGLAEKEHEARKPLLEQLEYDATGQMKNAGLSFDQRVQWSIARSLDRIAWSLDTLVERGR